MEALVGHRMWVSGVAKYSRQPETVYHFDAYSYVDAGDAEQALEALRTRVKRIAPTLDPGARDPSNEYYIASFYWTPTPDFADGKFHSSGVQLRHRYAEPGSIGATLDRIGAKYVLDANRA